MSSPDVAHKVALITGSTRGIGRAIAARFLAEGWACVLNGRRADTEIHRDVASLGHAVYQPGDVSDETDARALVAAATESWGRVDVVVNNAAYAQRIPHRDLEGVSREIWDRVLATNLIGPWNLARAAAEPLTAAGGSIINVSSLAGRRAAGSSIPYAVSKAALDHLTVVLAAALAPAVRVNAVAPGFIDNDRGDQREHVRELVSKRAPLRRPGRVEEVADACHYLANASYVTGETLLVDGGLHVR